MEAAAQTEHVADIHRFYDTFVEECRRSTIPSARDTLVDVLIVLAKSGESEDFARIERILTETPALLDLEFMPDVHETILQELVDRGSLESASVWLEMMHRRPGICKPTVDHWNILLYGSSRTEGLVASHRRVQMMKEIGYVPTNATYKILLEASFLSSSPPDVESMLQIFGEMRDLKLTHDPTIIRLLRVGYNKHNQQSMAGWMERLYRSMVLLSSEDDKLETVWLRRLAKTAHRHPVRARLHLFDELQKQGLVATRDTLIAMLGESGSFEDLQILEEHLNVKGDVVAWSIILDNALRKRTLSDALSIYELARTVVQPDAIMVHPLLRALCAPSLRPPTEEAIDRALAIYRDIVPLPVAIPTEETISGSPPACERGPDTPIYNTLLRALTSSPKTGKYLPVALDLIEDMRTGGVPFDNMTTTSLTIALMKSSNSFADAFDTYKRIRDLSANKGFDSQGFTALLNTFCKLSFGQYPPPPRDYFEIVRDMQRSGFPVTAHVYSIILGRLASLATSLRGQSSSQIQSRTALLLAIRRTHYNLSVDPGLNPTIVTWTQLMDAYQRVGSFSDALRVWDMIFITRQFDHASVSVIFDACAFAGASEMATDIQAKLFSRGFSFNQRNWNNWVECLCRLGRLDEAVKTVCRDMGKSQKILPNEESVAILLKFAHRTKQIPEVRSRVRQYLPDLWNRLPLEMKAD